MGERRRRVAGRLISRVSRIAPEYREQGKRKKKKKAAKKRKEGRRSLKEKRSNI